MGLFKKFSVQKTLQELKHYITAQVDAIQAEMLGNTVYNIFIIWYQTMIFNNFIGHGYYYTIVAKIISKSAEATTTTFNF